ncbi:MAG: ABC transporter permease [Nitrospiraceae bacterium]|nr:ABC transporter permease [Nitrospiraceae bacterium]
MEKLSELEDFDLVIDARRTEFHYWRDLWRYRGLFYFLSWRDVLVRYKQTAFGIAWAVLQPFLTMIVFTVVFGRLAKLPSGNVPYPVMVFAALLPWQFFANAFTASSNSLVSNANMVSKIYFPRLIIPASAVVVGFVDFMVSCVILAGMMIWYGFAPGWHILILPMFVLMTFFAAMGAGLLVSAMNVKYRDFRYVVPFIVQLGLYISPVGFSSSIVPARWRLLYSMNPMVGIIDGFRWAILGGGAKFQYQGSVFSMAVVALLLLAGILYFRRAERGFADII